MIHAQIRIIHVAINPQIKDGETTDKVKTVLGFMKLSRQKYYY